MELDEQVPVESRAEKIKASRLRSAQFRLTTVLGLMVLIAVLMAIPRFAGVEYKWYFQFLYVISYGCAPFLAWLTYVLLPKSFGSGKIVGACVIALALIGPFWYLVAWHDGEYELVRVVIVTCFYFWLPQIICIWTVWFFIFRRSAKRR